MKKVLLIAFLLVSAFINAQSVGVIEGTVFDKSNNNEPVTFASVTIKGTNISTTTDYRGNYFFKELPAGEYVVEVAFLGYKTQKQKIKVAEESKSKLDAYLEVTEAINFEALELSSRE